MASTWITALSLRQEADLNTSTGDHDGGWVKPPLGFVKCNIGSSWLGSNQISGAASAWILRDEKGKTLVHSRRSYSYMQSKTESELWSMLWAVESMHFLHKTNVIFEASSEGTREVLTNPTLFPQFSRIIHTIQSYLSEIEMWSLDHCRPNRNEAAEAIAVSVTRDHRHQSYIACNAPVWLHHLLVLEAQAK